MSEQNNDKASDDAKDKASKSTESAAEALRKLALSANPAADSQPSQHKFWNSQPVPQSKPEASDEDGPIQPHVLAKFHEKPVPLRVDGFEWSEIDMTNETEVNEVYKLLYDFYVEDTDAMFRFKYSPSFLNWALMSPGWKREWHVGVRTSSTKKLVAFVSGVPATLKVRGKEVKCSEVNFLCVHKKLRGHGLAPVLIREITRRCNLKGIWQAIYTGGTKLPTPISTCRYFHRSLNWQKLYEVGFSPMPMGSTKQRQIAKYKLPEKTQTKGLRPIKAKDVPSVRDLLSRYLARAQLAQDFTEEEISHWLLNEDNKQPEKVVWCFVVEEGGKITDFVSFYCVESTVMGNPQHSTIKAAYLFYYASEKAFQNEGAELGARLNELVHDALIIAKNEKFDVFNALSLMDNPLFLEQQKFGPGSGMLHYYLYNWKTSSVPSGIDEKGHLDVAQMTGVGVVML